MLLLPMISSDRHGRLVPRKPDPEIEKVFVDVDDAARIRAIHVFDAVRSRSWMPGAKAGHDEPAESYSAACALISPDT